MPKNSAYYIKLSLPVESVRDVCAYFFGLDALPVELRLEKETSWGYKAKCVRLLQQLCSMKERGVKAWGRGLEFADIPPIRQAQLTILMLRSKLQNAEAQIQQKDAQIKKMSRVIDVLQYKLSESRRAA